MTSQCPGTAEAVTSFSGMIGRVNPTGVHSFDMTAAAEGAGAGLTPLTTKLAVPPRRKSVLDRAHLLERLDAAASLRLTLVCAPAGFGKTTLLVEWLARAPARAGWLAVDSADNDPTRFWMYVVTALQRLEPCVGASARSLLQVPHGAPIDVVLTELVQDLAVLDQPLRLVLDDYHLIDTIE